MSFEIRVLRGHSTKWASVNPILDEGEAGLEVDTGQVKYGNGLDHYNDLPYVGEGVAGTSDPRIGDLATLTTTEQSSVVGAINEVNAPGALTTLYTNAKA